MLARTVVYFYRVIELRLLPATRTGAPSEFHHTVALKLQVLILRQLFFIMHFFYIGKVKSEQGEIL